MGGTEASVFVKAPREIPGAARVKTTILPVVGVQSGSPPSNDPIEVRSGVSKVTYPVRFFPCLRGLKGSFVPAGKYPNTLAGPWSLPGFHFRL